MKKLMIIAAAAAGMCLSVQAAGFTMPFTVTAVGTETKSTNLVAITAKPTGFAIYRSDSAQPGKIVTTFTCSFVCTLPTGSQTVDEEPA